MIVDLRSDTITRPTPEMYAAMASAPLGDDVLGDDPTVTKLEQQTAVLLGMEAGLFVPSGTMGNQIAIATHTKPGDGIVAEMGAHILFYEVGAPAILSNVITWTLQGRNGIMDPDLVRTRVLQRNLHTPGTSMICVENTHNRAGGAVLPLDTLKEYRQIADQAGIRLHMDGARVWNAAVASGTSLKDIAGPCHSISVCLSKGLRGPVGSVLCGEHSFIEEARYWRKRLGGGMRQAGLLAACGLVALTQIDRLADDHTRARRVAEALHAIRPDAINLDSVQTNIVLVQTQRPAEQWQNDFEAKGIRFFPVAENRFRLVFHADVDDAQTDYALLELANYLKAE